MYFRPSARNGTQNCRIFINLYGGNKDKMVSLCLIKHRAMQTDVVVEV
jgi:hypothetical protein